MYAHHCSHAGLDGRLRHHKATWRAFFVSEVTLILAVGQSREQEQRGHLRWWCAGAAVVLVYHRLSCQCSAPGDFCYSWKFYFPTFMQVLQCLICVLSAMAVSPSVSLTDFLVECLCLCLQCRKVYRCILMCIIRVCWTGMVKCAVCCNAVAQAAGAGWTWILRMVRLQIPAIQGKQLAASLDSYSLTSIGYHWCSSHS